MTIYKTWPVFVCVKILDNVASVALETGSRQGYLFTMEWYTNNVIATPLNPCVLVDLETTSEGGRELQIRQSIYDQTVKVIEWNPETSIKWIIGNNLTETLILGHSEDSWSRLQPRQQRDHQVHHGRDRIRSAVHGRLRRRRDVLPPIIWNSCLHRSRLTLQTGSFESSVFRRKAWLDRLPSVWCQGDSHNLS